ncbi:hypothetical protein [Allokutzneria oryzae]|uniref:Uncharacterized protein n=1 Tax=Allokutzneria oryzae TaxID=1378989 RepID=A0ABV5ZXJ9_9PSEU
MSNRIGSTLLAVLLAVGGAFTAVAPASAAPAWQCGWKWNGSDYKGGKACIRVNGGNFEAWAEISSVPKGCRSITLYVFEDSPNPRRGYTNFSCEKGKTDRIRVTTRNHKGIRTYAQVQIHTGDVTGPIRRESKSVKA